MLKKILGVSALILCSVGVGRAYTLVEYSNINKVCTNPVAEVVVTGKRLTENVVNVDCGGTTLSIAKVTVVHQYQPSFTRSVIIQ